MSARKPRGFTLVELLVVVVIISVLVGLLLPAVLRSRESARRTTCMNNQHEIAAALHQFETSAGQWPGWINSVGSRNGLTWAAMLLPHLGHNDVWSLLRVLSTGTAGVQLNPANIPTTIPVFVCPDNTSTNKQDFALNYVVNCGFYDPSLDFTVKANQPMYGLFVNRDKDPAYNRLQDTVTRSEGIKDGAQNTIAFSENIISSQWFTLGTSPASPPVLAVRNLSDSTTNYARRPWVIDSAILWTSASVAPSQQYINAGMYDSPTPDFPWGKPEAITPWDASTDPGAAFRKYCRPSSYHPGGVVVTYCDGHQDFVADSIAHSVYVRSLIPDDSAATAAGAFSTTWSW